MGSLESSGEALGMSWGALRPPWVRGAHADAGRLSGGCTSVPQTTPELHGPHVRSFGGTVGERRAEALQSAPHGDGLGRSAPAVRIR